MVSKSLAKPPVMSDPQGQRGFHANGKRGDQGVMKKGNVKAIPYPVIQRLPVYHRELAELASRGVERISSTKLAEKIGITASQLRQDLNHFGSFGQQGYGYNVPQLLVEVGRILGLDRTFKMVLVGVGNLGMALVRHSHFRRRGFVIDALFDVDTDLIRTEVAGLPVRPLSELVEYCHREQPDIGVITTPEEVAQAVADMLVKGGVQGIWSFSSTRLMVPDHVVVENINLIDSLMSLGFRLRQLQDRP